MNIALLSLVALAVICSVSGLAPRKPTRYPKVTKIPKTAYKKIEGDMRVSQHLQLTKRNAVASEGLLWPNGVVPYTISKRFNATSKRLFKKAMKVIEDATSVNGKKCIQFVQRRKQANYVHLEMYRDCWSDIGRHGTGKQLISLGQQCYTKGTVMHELIHTLGFYHEQSRADRDYYVDIHYENIKDGLANDNFKKYALGTAIDHLDQPYDYDSIMHYQWNSFSKDPKNLPTISAKMKLPYGVVLGQRDHLSQIDIKMIQKLYNCDVPADDVTKDGVCKDKLENCPLYGERACQELPTWAAKNCAVTCKICTPVCADKISDCADYGDYICKGSYRPWAEQNCEKYCGFGHCQAPVDKIAAPETCVDKISDCADYGDSVCRTHKSWASERCSRFCGFCKLGQKVGKTTRRRRTTTATTTTTRRTTTTATRPTTTSTTTSTTTTAPVTRPKITIKLAECLDRVDDCADYGTEYCSGAYAPYMRARCPKFCGFCHSEEPTFPPTTESSCKDSISNCADYGGPSVCTEYSDWASTNCQAYCKLCNKPNCKDEREDCYSLGKFQCGGQYTSYMRQNCADFCGYC